MSSRVTEIPFPLTMWPHALLQTGLVAIVAVGEWEAAGFFSNLVAIAGAAGPLPIAILWLAFLLLISEAITRRSQHLALRLSPKNHTAFRFITAFLATALIYVAFTMFLTVLSRILGTWQIAKWGHIPFFETCRRLFWAEMPLLILFGLGESARQVIYARPISDWRQAMLLRKQTLPQDQDEE